MSKYTNDDFAPVMFSRRRLANIGPSWLWEASKVDICGRRARSGSPFEILSVKLLYEKLTFPIKEVVGKLSAIAPTPSSPNLFQSAKNTMSDLPLLCIPLLNNSPAFGVSALSPKSISANAH